MAADSGCWLTLPRRLLGLAFPDAPDGVKGAGEPKDPFYQLPVPPSAAPALRTPETLPPPEDPSRPPCPTDALVADAYARILVQAGQQVADRVTQNREEESESTESEYSDSEEESEEDSDEESETELTDLRTEESAPESQRDILLPNTGMPSESPTIPLDESGVVRPPTALMSHRRPSTAPHTRPTLTTNLLSSRLLGMPTVACPKPPKSGMSTMRAAAQALAQCVSRAVTGGESKGGGEGLAGQGTEIGGIRWPSNGTTPSNSALCQAQRPFTHGLQQPQSQQQLQLRRVPPAALMASSWWRNMEQQSPAFAAVSQRFQAIAQAQARERLASNLARLAVLHEAEEASRDQQEALRNALGMPALAAWAQTKARDPLPAFLLRTLAALLDLSVEMVKHGVLLGWVLLGVFNRLLFEVLTANRPVQTGVMLAALVFAGYVGLLGDITDFESFFWDV